MNGDFTIKTSGLALLAAASLLVGACPDTEPAPSADSVADVASDVASDAADDAVAPDAIDAADGSGPDLPVVDNPHSCLDPGVVTYIPGDPVACEHGCLDADGKSKKTLCPEPISDWNCIAGCCMPVFTCQTDADCIVYGYESGNGCSDDRYDCACDISSGTCHNTYCGANSDCCGDESCSAGACIKAPTELLIRIVSGVLVLTPGATAEVHVEAYDPANPDVALPAGTLTWDTSSSDAVAVAAGTVTGGTSAGTSTVTATAEGGASDSVIVSNVVPPADATLTVVTVIEGTNTPVVGRYALVDRAAATTIAVGQIPADGVLSTSAAIPAGGLDVHVMGDDTDWVSTLGAQGPIVYLPVRRTTYGEIELNQDAELVPAGTTLAGTNIVRGVPDFSEYPVQGEFEVSLSSFALSSGLLDFNLDAILGSSVKRYFDPDFPLAGLIDVTKQSEIPGGLTFGLEGPAIPDIWLAAPAGSQTLWTLGGRAPATEVTPYIGDIINAVEGDTLDLGRVVTAVIPLFGQFYSAVTPGIESPGDESMDITSVAPKMRVPLSQSTTFTVPALPELEAGVWAEVVFMLAGALRADGTFVPMGLNAGADTSNAETNSPDGLADADDKTSEIDPYTLAYAPMHSGLSGVTARYASALVALSIDPGGGSTRRDAGSALLNRAPLGEPLPADLPLQEFMPFASGSTYDATTRQVTVSTPAGAESTRVLFKGKQGVNWNIWLNGTTDYTVPVPEELLGSAAADRTTDLQLLLINSLDFAEGISLGDLLSPGGVNLDRLLLVVDRASFLDVRP